MKNERMVAGAGIGRAADQLIAAFVDLIDRGELKDGDPLPPEREIVERFGVSRTVAREAVQALANRGLVDAQPRFRPVVRRPSFDTAMRTIGGVVSRLLGEEGGVRNLFETRILVECALVREAARSANSVDIARLERALAANEAAIGDSPRFYQTDRALHGLFYQMAGNPILMATHEAYSEWLSPYWLRMGNLSERNASNYAAHKTIVETVKLGDADAAERLLRSHFADAWEQVRDTFD